MVEDESLHEQLEVAAREGLDYLRTALRTGDAHVELLSTARFLLEINLAYHNHEHEQEDYTYIADDDEDDEE